MNIASPSTKTGRRILLAGLLIASTPLPIYGADDKTPSRLPAVSTTTTLPPPKQPSSAVPLNVEGLFASFKAKKAEARLAASTSTAIGRDMAKATTQRWLRSSTSGTCKEVARRLITQASGEYAVGAWASAESSAWEAIRQGAEGVELAARESDGSNFLPALANLQIARTAIREARDFRNAGNAADAGVIGRLVMSHNTTLLASQPLENLTATDAIDRYLDEARVRLSGIAARSVEAAQAMDLLAAIHLARADARTLPSSTALCLRRAALQGQPKNASLAMRLGMHLADLGLYSEARWALEHSLKLQPSDEAADALVIVLRRSGKSEEAANLIATMQNNSLARERRSGPRVPEVTELSPEEFAAISRQVVKTPQGQKNVTGKLASAKQNVVHESREIAVVDPLEGEEKPSIARRFLNSFKRVW